MALEILLHPTLLHPHTGLPLQAVGTRRNGDPIWPVLGASDDDGDDGDDGADGDDDAAADGGAGNDDDAKKLGDKGQAALERMKATTKTARAEAKAWKSVATEFGASTVEELRAKLRGDKADDTDPEAVRAQAERDAQARADQRIVRAEVKAAAAGKLADPGDAARFLDLSTFDLDADGNVDEDEVKDAIDELLKKRPYLAAATAGEDPKTRRSRSDRSQGARGGGVSQAQEQARAQLERRGYARTTQ